jgi:peptidyl-prolyl cis-trans isomerase D
MFRPPDREMSGLFLSVEGFFMLDQLRQGAQGWVSKVLMGLLVLSFAIWGIGGFTGYGAGTLATVGDTEVSVRDYARIYDQARRNAAQAGQTIRHEQVLSILLSNAAMDDAASEYGLGVSDDRVATEIAKNPAFARPDGSFDRDRFAFVLDNAGMNRDDFVQDMRRELVRNQISDTIGAGLEVPEPLVAALYRLQNEERAVSFIVIDAASIDPIGAPADSDLQAYFDDNKDSFQAPEYRKLALLSLDPAALADPNAVSAEDVAAEYERVKSTLTQSERRRIEEIRFPTAEAAEAAMKRIEAGEDFAAVAAASGTEVTDQGVKTKAEMLDPVVADAAFAAIQDKPVLVTEGAIEPSIVRVTSIEPEKVTTLAEAEANLRKELATRAARESAHDLYDKVEDERAGGATLEEAAANLKLPYRVVEAVSADLKASDGTTITDIPAAQEVVKEAFESDVGVENSPIRGDGESWVFYDVLEVTPARARTLDEVRDQVVQAWTAAETERRISELTNSLLDRLKKGETLAKIASETGKTVQTLEGVKRNQPANGLTVNAVNQAFAGPEGHVAAAEGNGTDRILLKVDRVTAPAFFPEAADAAAIREQIGEALKNDLLVTYNRQLLDTRATSVNSAVYQQLSGQQQTQ